MGWSPGASGGGGGGGSDPTAVHTDAVGVFTKQQNFGEVALTSSSGSIAWNLDNAQSAKHTMSEDTTLANPSNMVAGGTYVLRIKQHASSPKTLAFGSAYRWSAALGEPILTPVAGALDIFTFISDGTLMHGTYNQDSQ